MKEQLQYCALVAGAGTLLFVGRSMRIMTQFRHVRDIPASFIRGQIRLRGRLKDVQSDGSLRIMHEPLIPIARLLNRDKPLPNITIELAALEVGAAGRQWLLDNLRNQNVYLRLIRRTEGAQSVQAEMIAYKGAGLPYSVWAYSVNRELVRRGYARMKDDIDVEHLQAVADTPAYSRLVNQLQIVETETGRTSRAAFHESIHAYPIQAREIIENSSAFRVSILLLMYARQLMETTRDVLKMTYLFCRRHYPQARYYTMKMLATIAQAMNYLYTKMLRLKNS